MFKKANNDLPLKFIRYFQKNEDVHNYDTYIIAWFQGVFGINIASDISILSLYHKLFSGI